MVDHRHPLDISSQIAHQWFVCADGQIACLRSRHSFSYNNRQTSLKVHHTYQQTDHLFELNTKEDYIELTYLLETPHFRNYTLYILNAINCILETINAPYQV